MLGNCFDPSPAIGLRNPCKGKFVSTTWATLKKNRDSLVEGVFTCHDPDPFFRVIFGETHCIPRDIQKQQANDPD